MLPYVPTLRATWARPPVRIRTRSCSALIAGLSSRACARQRAQSVKANTFDK
jgi:hypothetical protein